MTSYEVGITPTLVETFDGLPQPQHDDILLYLGVAAETAFVPLPVGGGGWHHRHGMHHGLHRASVGPNWVVFRVDHGRHTLDLVDFGERRSRPNTPDEGRWESEGGR